MENLEKQPLACYEIKEKFDKALKDRLWWLQELYEESDKDMQNILAFEIEDITKLRKQLKKH